MQGAKSGINPNEGSCFGQENLQELQSGPPRARDSDPMLEPAA